MSNDTTNAWPVLPEHPLQVNGGGWTAREIRLIEAYGRQCAEHVAGPLRERVAELERELIALKAGAQRVENLCRAISADRDRLRAENEALRKFIAEYRRAAIACMNTVTQTRGCDGMDGLANANDRARDLLAAIDAARAAREGA